MTVEKRVIKQHIPDWHPSLSALLGDIVGEKGYITEAGTVRLLGEVSRTPDIPESKTSSTINGPTIIFSAQSSLGFA